MARGNEISIRKLRHGTCSYTSYKALHGHMKTMKTPTNSESVKTLILLYALLVFFTSMIIYTVIRVDSITSKQNINNTNYLSYHKANADFRQGTDILTNAVRRYVVTYRKSPDGKWIADSRYIRDYFDEVQKGLHRDRALAAIKKLGIDPSLKITITKAMDESRDLMYTEYHAMHLIAPENHKAIFHKDIGHCPLTEEEQKMTPEERRQRAEELLWDDKYINTKVRIYSYLNDGLEDANIQAEARHMQLRKELLHMLTLSAVSLIAMVVTISGIFFYRRYQHERMIERQAEENARMNAQLKEERDKAIKAEKARSYFFSTVSHDIRTPLNSIIGFSEMLQLGIDDPDEKEKALDAIITSGQTLLELINDVLDLSKLESGKMELHPVPTDITALIGKVVTSFETATCRTSIMLRTEIDRMPFLKLDPQRIRQILFNLVGNAVKFTAKGSVTVRATYKDSTFTLSVIDTGCGISEENIGKLMSPYVQLHTHDSIQGTGLGLAICKQLSKQMDGTLELASTLGKGTTFTLRIPNVQAFTEKESQAYVSEYSAPKVKEQLDESVIEKCFLIVDDQKLNRRILQTMLGRLGIHKVLTAGNGKEALDVLDTSGNVDIVLTDMSMPVMDGAALVGAIRKSPRFAKLPVYVITADVEMQNEYKQAGFDDMLIKPITLDKLRNILVKYAPSQSGDVTSDGKNKA